MLATLSVFSLRSLRLSPIFAELCQLAHRRGIFVHVDGAQTWGALDLDLSRLGCDSFAASAHKWFMGPKEGLLFVRKENVARIWPGVISVGWGDDAQADPEGARKFETLGQRDDAALAALGAALSASTCRICTPALSKGAVGVTHWTSARPKPCLKAWANCRMRASMRAGPITRCSSARPLSERLYREHGIAAATTGGLRLCPHIYNTQDHIERAVQGIDQAL